MYICFGCNTIYDFVPIKHPHGGKQCKRCDDEVVVIDELIAPAIIELNRRGYITEFCCSDHWYNPVSCYVLFNPVINNILPERFFDLPDGFFFDEPRDDGAIVIRKFTGGNMMAIVEANLRLWEWAKSLPVLEDFCNMSKVKFTTY